MASERLAANGLPPLPHVTAHTLRRTYVSVMLLATNFDLSFVQGQVGHTDSKLTMDVYAQLLDRSKRSHGVAFDALVSNAQATLY
jgi:integrase